MRKQKQKKMEHDIETGVVSRVTYGLKLEGQVRLQNNMGI